MSVKVYEYANCSTCRKATKYLEEHSIAFQKIPIVDQPPSINELEKMLASLKKKGLTFKALFNTSGQMYRELHLSEKIKEGMTESEALKLLAKNGKLIKRPFVITDKDGTVGFQDKAWDQFFKV